MVEATSNTRDEKPYQSQTLKEIGLQLADKDNGKSSHVHEKSTSTVRVKSDDDSDVEEKIIPLVIRPGHIRFKPLKKDADQAAWKNEPPVINYVSLVDVRMVKHRNLDSAKESSVGEVLVGSAKATTVGEVLVVSAKATNSRTSESQVDTEVAPSSAKPKNKDEVNGSILGNFHQSPCFNSVPWWCRNTNNDLDFTI